MKAVLPRLSAKLAAAEPVSVIVLGDSIARGDEALTPARGFVSLCATRMHERFGSRVLVTNMFQGGNTAKDALQLLRLKRSVYDLVMVAIGMNDAALRGSRPAVGLRRFGRAIGTIVRKAQSEGSDVLLISPCIPSPDFKTALIDNYRVALEEQAAKSGCAFADVTAAWRERGGTYLLRNDLNHPDDAGHAPSTRRRS